MTKLLVSVRNTIEADAALAGGADIIDIKEPARGSLGMADAETIAEVARSVSTFPEERRPVSAALGEAREWLAGEHAPLTFKNLTYTKLGLAGLTTSTDWKSEWIEARGRVEDQSQPIASRWIAVAYVDWQAADAPPPREVIDAAGETDCAGVLFDTFRKDNRGLLDCLPLPELTHLIAAIQAAGMLAALAGGLQREHAGLLAGTRADVLAIRTAACEDGRNGTVTALAVRTFRAAMDAAQNSFAGKSGAHPAR